MARPASANRTERRLRAVPAQGSRESGATPHVHDWRVLFAMLERDLELETVAGLTFDKGLWPSLRGAPWPAVSRFDPRFAVRRAYAKVDFVRRLAHRGRVRAMGFAPAC